jgi:hypothetical protein
MTSRRTIVAAIITAVSTILLIAGVPAASATPTAPAADPNAGSWHCGGWCEGRDPYTYKLNYSNGATFTCAETRTLIASGHPKGTNSAGNWYTDTNMTVWLYYSTFCQVLWVEAKNYKAIGRTHCEVWLGGAGTNGWPGLTFGCPSAGHAMNTPMWDDYCATGCTWLAGELNEAVNGYYPSWYHAY